MGASLTVIDRHYGHLARDGRERAIRLLDTLTTSETMFSTPVDVRVRSMDVELIDRLRERQLTTP